MTTACSSDLARFSDAPFSNPFQGKVDTAVTGSVKSIKASTLGVAPATQSLARNSGNQTVAAATQVAASGNQAVSGSLAGWTATGGTAITAGAGDTIETLSGRYGVPTSALRAVNGINGGQPSAGQRIIIPAYKPGAPAAKVASNGTTNYAPAAQANQSHAPRYESLSEAPKAKAAPRKPRYESLSVEPKTQARKAEAAAPKAAKVKAKKPVDDDADDAPAKRTSDKASVKKSQKQAAKPAPKQAVKRTVENDVDQPLPPKAPMRPGKVATAAEPKSAKAEAKATEAAKTETTASVEQDFRWPARGRVISGYGSKGPSGNNDGINIAVPEGTSVKAAEGGTVAYAGEEIKGYGKMVLIRHPNGYVSAYAHNGDLNVKRGDVVKRGQQIAKSGQTGNVTSPQLHFELRKGSEPVDPSKFLD